MAATCAWLLTRPAYLGYVIMAGQLGRDDALRHVSEAMAGIPGLRGVWCRRLFYRSILPHVGSRVHIGYQTLLSKADAHLHEGVYIGRMCTLGRVTLAREAILADGVQVLSGRHQHQSSDTGSFQASPQTFSRVRIGRGAWVGANAVVMADVGDHAVVAAGAVVVEPVPPYTTVAGVPARVIKSPLAKAA